MCNDAGDAAALRAGERLEDFVEGAAGGVVVAVVDVDVGGAAVGDEAGFPAGDAIFFVEGDEVVLAEEDARAHGLGNGDEAVVRQDYEDGRIPDSVFFCFGNDSGYLRVCGFGGGVCFGAERAVKMFFVVNHCKMEEKQIRLRFLDRVAGDVGEGGVGLQRRDDARVEVRIFFRDLVEDAACRKRAQQLQIFGNIGAPDFGNDDVGLSAHGDRPVNQGGVEALLAGELPERGDANVFFVPAVAVVILSEGIPCGICDDAVGAGIYTGHHGGVRGVGDGGHYGLDAIA